MKLTTLVRAALLVLAGASLAAFVRAEPPRQRWEHHCSTLTRGNPLDRGERMRTSADSFPRMGTHGWELVAVIPHEGVANTIYCFKRPAP